MTLISSKEPDRRGLRGGIAGIVFACVLFLTACGLDKSSRLVRAVEQGDVPRTRALLADGADPNARTGEGVPVLEKAIRAGHTSIAELLIGQGSDVNGRDSKTGSTALMAAAFLGHSQLIELLLAKGADINARTATNGTALGMAALAGRVQVTTALLKRGAGTAADRAGALVAAAWAGHDQVVRMLIAGGAPVDGVRNKSGQTALLAAIAASRYNARGNIVRLLLAEGANLKAVDADGRTALILAISVGDAELVPILLDNGADPSLPDRSKRGPLEHGIAAERVDVVRALLGHGASPTALMSDGQTPLSMAASRGVPEVAEALLVHGANVNAKDRDGQTPLMKAVLGWSDKGSMNRRRGTVALLLRAGADPNTRTPNGLTALRLARDEDEEITRMLRTAGGTM